MGQSMTLTTLSNLPPMWPNREIMLIIKPNFRECPRSWLKRNCFFLDVRFEVVKNLDGALAEKLDHTCPKK